MTKKNASILRLRLIGTVYLIVFIALLNSFCTQFIASRLGYHPALGAPLIWKLHPPFDWWRWLFSFYDTTPSLYHAAFIFFVLGILIALVTFVLWVGFTSRSSRKHEDVHGTAHFATLKELQATGLLPQGNQPGRGVYCGAYQDKISARLHYLRHNGPEHICALAPTRSGKGVGLVVPTLLSWPESVFVLDRKGENYAMTAGWRGQQANNVILRFDPAEPGLGCAWNPLGEIRFATRYQVSDAQNVALMVVDSDGDGIEGNHFRTAAFELLVGLILHALYKGQAIGLVPCLQDCAHMLTSVGEFSAQENKK